MEKLIFGVATFNAENLIGPNKSIYSEKESRYTEKQYKEKTTWINTQIKYLNASIIGFQEIFEEAALRDCFTPGENWNISISPGNGKSPRNALISKYQIIEEEFIEEIPNEFQFFDDFTPESAQILLPIKAFSRPILKAKVRITEKQNINLLVAHLKSKNPILPQGMKRDTTSFSEIAIGSTRSLIRRAVESCGLRKIVSDLLTKDLDTPLIVLGDLNDDTYAVTNQSILGETPYYKLPQEIREARWNLVLQNARTIQARKSIESHIYSYIHNGHYECLDNIFISNHLSDQNPKRIGRVIDVKSFNDHLSDDTFSSKKDITKSDHGQIVAFLEMQNFN